MKRIRPPRHYRDECARGRPAFARARPKLRTRRWSLREVFQVDDAYLVCPAGGSLYDSEAVSRAVELKRRSQGTMAPKLVRAG